MAGQKRIVNELQKLKDGPPSLAGAFQLTPTGSLTNVEGLLLPKTAPYNNGAFRVMITLPDNYPHSAPTFNFKTPIYHPCVKQEDGDMCLKLLNDWSATKQIVHVLEEVLAALENPPDHVYRDDLLKEYRENRDVYMKKATDFTAKNAERRP